MKSIIILNFYKKLNISQSISYIQIYINETHKILLLTDQLRSSEIITISKRSLYRVLDQTLGPRTREIDAWNGYHNIYNSPSKFIGRR